MSRVKVGELTLVVDAGTKVSSDFFPDCVEVLDDAVKAEFNSSANVILIGGIQTERTQFCVGEELTLLCQNDTLGYDWIYSSERNIVVTPGANARRTADGFTATYVNATTTTLQFVVSSDMNGITITCTDVFDAINISATNMELLDTLSMACPDDISAVGIDNCTSVDVSLRGVFRCTREYTASISGEIEVISSVLNEDNHDTELLAIGSFNLSNSSLELCSKYNVSVNVTFFDNSRMACASVAVELPTNPSSARTTMQSISTAVLPSSSFPVRTIIIIVVMIVVCLLVLLAVIVIILCFVRKRTKIFRTIKPQENPNKEKQDPDESALSGDECNTEDKKSKKKGSSKSEDETPLYSSGIKNKDSRGAKTLEEDQHIIPHKESASGEVYALPKNKNKGSKKNGKSDMRENSEGNTREGDQHIIPHKKSPSGEMYALPKNKNKGSKKNGKSDMRENSEEGNTRERGQHVIPHKESPSGEVYALPKNKKGSKKNGKSDMRENLEEGNTRERLNHIQVISI